MKHQSVVIIDYGSQYTQLITRRIRELGIYSVVLSATRDLATIQSHSPRAIILSGGPNSVYDKGAPQLADGFLNYISNEKIPVLGICYGMQLLSQQLGGKVEPASHREYGRMAVRIDSKSSLFREFLSKGKNTFQAWMSHGDEVKVLPEGFTLCAKSEAGGVAAIENSSRKLFGLQFHPEVQHTEMGLELIKHFLTQIAEMKSDWTMGSVIDEQIEKIRAIVPKDAHVICGLSGGVDSTVAAVLVHRAIGDRLHCCFVDHGLLRFDEQARVMKMFKDQLHLPVNCVDASERFLSQLAGVVDPEKKRKIIGAEFIVAFEEFSKELEKRIEHAPAFLVQGTLYPDVIESSPGLGHSVTIKSHHNVGGLPEKMRMKLIEPLRDLFKDEVRAMGRELKIPEDFLMRHPFPGPGLAVRIMGDITRERIEILQKVDEVFIQSLKEAGLYSKVWQAFAVFLPIRTVGVQGDGRTHDHVVALRAVSSSDGMTADWYPFEHKFLSEVSAKITNSVRGVNRVVYDISSKPPATIEWE